MPVPGGPFSKPGRKTQGQRQRAQEEPGPKAQSQSQRATDQMREERITGCSVKVYEGERIRGWVVRG